MTRRRAARAAVGAIAALVALYCVYRVLTFVPQPLDSPRTLRPILYAAFSKFSAHYPDLDRAQQAWSTCCLILLFVPAILALLNYLASRAAGGHRMVRSRALFCASVAPPLLLARVTAMLYGQINPDESLFLAAAHMLFRDPIFFRAVDCGTTGPFNVYPLMLPALVGLTPDYASTRLIGVLLILASIYTIYGALALLADDAIARVAVLPAAGAFACLKHDDFLSYGAEHVSFLLVSIAFYLAVKTFRKPESRARTIAGLGLIAAVTFLARMQAVPIIVCAAAVAIAYVHRNGLAVRWWKPALWFAAGFAPLLLLNAIVCAAAGAWTNFWMEYILGSFRYVASRSGAMIPELSRLTEMAMSGVVEIRILTATLAALLAVYAYQQWRPNSFLQMGVAGGMAAIGADLLLRTAGTTILSYAWILAMLLLPGAFILLYRSDPGPVQWFGFLAAALLAASAVAVYVPHRLFAHYLLLLVFPIAICMAWPVIAGSRNIPCVLIFATLTLADQVFQIGYPETLPFAGVPAGVRGPDGALIDSLTSPSGAITVWGWNARPYLASGRRSATVDLNMFNMFLADPQLCAYRRADYLRALKQCPPELFVDALDTSLKGFANRSEHGFEVIPDIKSFVQTNYVHVMDAYSEHFYIRRDLAPSAAGLNEPRCCDPEAIRCFDAGADATLPAALAPVEMPEHALIEIAFTPEIAQDAGATIFSNDAGTAEHKGLIFQHTGGDRYRLAIGLGTQWVYSKEISVPRKRPASLSIELRGNVVSLACNGAPCDEIRLPARPPQSTGSITVGCGIGYQHPFLGNIRFFQIRRLS